MRLSSGHRSWVYWGGALVFGSGILWLLCHYLLQSEGEFGPTPHPLEHWSLRIHGAAAMLALVLAGSLLPIHMRRSWHQRRNLLPGIALTSIVLLLTVSGYALYYFGGEQLRPILSLTHWAVGLGSPVLLLWHIVSGRAAAAASRSRQRQGLAATAPEPQQAHDGRAA